MKKNKLLIALLAGAVGGGAYFGAGVGAQAQDQTAQDKPKPVGERPQEDYDAKGIRAGAFQLFPVLEITETYDDNIFAVNTGETSDYLTDFSPQLKIKSDWGRHALNFDASANITRYADNDKEDYEHYDFGVDGRIDATKAVTIDLGAKHGISTEERGSPDDVGGIAPTDTDTTTLDGGIKYKANRISVELDGEFKRLNFDDVATTTGITNNDDRDRDEFVGTLRLGYEIQEEYEAFVEVTYTTIDYSDALDDGGFNRDSDGPTILAGVDLDLGGLLRGDISAGYLQRSFDDATLKDISGFNAGVGLTWNPTELTTVKPSFSRNIQETTSANVSSFITTSFGITVDHELRRNIILGARASFAADDYQGTNREDETVKYGLSVDYKLNRNFYLGVDYNFKDKTSNQVGSDQTVNTAFIRLGAQF